MAKQLNVDLRINADIKQAKQAMAELEKKLDSIITSRTINVEDKSINEAKQAAIDLKRHLEEATNVQTGKINLSKFSSSLKQSGQNLQGLYNKITQIGPAGQGAFLSLAQSVAKADTASINLKSKLGGLLVTLKNTAKWQISSSILHGFMGAIQGAYGYAQDLNESLNNIRIVTGQNIDQMSKFAAEANKAAKALSTSTTSYTDAALIYYQQGLNDEEVKERTDATIKLANVSRQSAEEVSSQMTAIWNNFKTEGKTVEYYADVITSLGASTASSSSEIAEGLSKFASVADTVGLSYEKASAALATVVAETRQSADVVGTAFKTIFARLEGLQLGETLEDNVDLNKYSKALAAIGVNILDANGQIKSMNDILDETGAKWENIGKEQQIALAQTVAGTRQYTQFISLMDNYNKVQKNETVAKNSEGTVQKQADTYAESWEAASKRVNAALQSIYEQLINDKAFIQMLNGIEKFISMIGNIIQGLGGIKGILLTVGSIFMQYYAKEMPAFLQKTIQDLRILSGSAEKTRINTISGLDEIIQKMTAVDSSKALNGQLTGMQTLSKMYLELAQKRRYLSSTEVEAYEQKIKEIEAYKVSAEAIGKEIDKIKEKKNELNKDAKTDLLNSKFLKTQNVDKLNQEQQNAVVKLIPEINKENINKAEEEIKKINEKINENEEKKKEVLNQQENFSNEFDKENNKDKKNILEESFYKAVEEEEKLKKETKELQGELEQLKKKSEQLKNSFSGKDLLKGFEDSHKTLSKMNVAIKAASDKTEQWKNKFNTLGKDSSTKALIKEMEEYKIKLGESGLSVQKLEESIKKFKQDQSKENFQDVMNNFNESSFKEKDGGDYDNAKQKMLDYREALMSLGVGEDILDSLSEAYDKGALSEEQYLAILKQLGQEQESSLTHTASISESLMKFASVMTSVVSVVNAFQNLGSIWENEDLSTGEKILQTMTTFGTLIPMLISLYNTLGFSKIKNIALSKTQALADAGDAAAKATLAGQTFIATVAQHGLNAALKANPIGAVITLVVGLVAALAIATTAFLNLANAESSEEKAVKQANKALEEAKKIAEETKQAYEDLKSKISNYDDSVKALKECTKGTQEWRDAFQEVLNNANELIQKYPALLSYSNLFNENGTLNEDVLKEVKNKMARGASATEMTASARAYESQKAQYKLDKEQTSEKLIKDFRDEVIKNTDNINNLSTDIARGVIPSIVESLLKEEVDINDSQALENLFEEKINTLGYSGKNASDAIDELTKSIVKIIPELENFKIKTENIASAQNSSKTLRLETIFGKEFSDEEKLSYNQVVREEIAQIRKKYANYTDETSKSYQYLQVGAGLFGTHDDYNRMMEEEGGKQIIETAMAYINKINPNLALKKDNVFKEENGVFKINFENGESVSLSDIITSLVNAELVETKDIIAKKVDDNDIYKNLNSAVVSYAVNNNYSSATIGDLQKLQNDKVKAFSQLKTSKGDSLMDENGTWQDGKIREFLIEQGEKAEDVTESRINKWKENTENELNNTLKEYEEKIPKGLRDIFNNNDIFKNLNIGQAKELSSIYSQMLKNVGEEGAKKILTDLADASASEFNKVIEAIKNKNIDFSNMNVDEANEALSKLGVSFKFTENQFYTFRLAIQEVGVITAETAQETLKTVTSILSKLKAEGDIIEDKNYKELLALNPAIESFFTTLADGTHMLTGEAQDFKTAMQTAVKNQLYQAVKNQENLAVKYDNYANLKKVVSAEQLKKQGTVYAAGGAISYFRSSDDDLYNKYRIQVDSAIELLKASSDQANQELGVQLENQAQQGKKLNDVALKAIDSVKALGKTGAEFAAQSKKATEEAGKLTEAIKETQYQFDIQNAGLEYETTENYANVLMELYEAEGLSKDAARALSIANQRLDRGLSSLNDNFEKITKSLKNTNKASAEYANTIGSLRKSFADLLNIADGEELSTKWIEKWANDADKMKKILNGDTKAIQEFRESAFTEMTNNVFEEVNESAKNLFDSMTEADGKDIYDALQKLINQLDNGKISAEGLKQELDNIGSTEIGSKAVLSKEYTEALNTMLAQGLLTEQQLNDIFATIGYKPKVTVKDIKQEVNVPIYRTYTKYDNAETAAKGTATGWDDKSIKADASKVTWTEQIGTKKMVQTVPAVQIVSDEAAGGVGEIEVVNAGSMNITPSYNSTTSGKASDSSKKDSSSNPTTKAASHDHEVNRYSNEENAIKDLSEQYDRLNKAKDKAFGRSRIETIEAEIKKLKALKQASSNYLDAIVGNGNASKVAKALYNGEDIGKMIASGWVGGTVKADYNSLFSGLSASGKGLEYTAKDEAGNEWLVSDSYSLSKFNSTFGTNLQFNLDSYGNIQNKDAIYNLLQNLANTENDAYSKMANPTADSTTEYNKRMALLKEIKERIDQYGETADLLTEKTDEYLDYISSLQEKNAELITTKMEHGVNLGEKTLQKISRSLKILGDDIYRTAEGMSKWFNLTFEESVKANQQQADAYVEALKDAEQKINLYDQKDGQFNEDAIDPASAAEIFQSIEDGSDRLINDLLNDMEEGKEHFGKTLDYWNEKIERVNSAIEKNGDLLNHFQNILGLLGKNTDYQLMSKVIQGQLDNATSNYNTRKAEAQNAKEVYEKAQRGKEELIQLGVSDEALRVYEENTLQKALEDYQDKADKMYSALEKSIELSNQLFENEVNRIFAESEKRLAGKWGSFDALDSAMQRQQSVAEEYLTKTNQLYETNSMLRKLSQDIDKTDSSIAKAKLKAFSDEIAAMKTQEKLSKTDLEIAKARYEVLQAQIALEEAQNAKSTVRLQRDNEGNYGYVYTADQDKIADAEQKLEDKQNELYNLGLKKAEEYGQKIISIRKEWQAELKKIEEDFQNGIITSEEEYNLIVSDINQKYQALELSYMDTYTKANLLLNETGAEGQTEAWTNSFDEIISTQRVFSDDSESEANQLTNALNEQMNWLNDQREYYTEEAKVGNEELDDSIQEIIDTTKDLEQELIGQNGLVDSMSKTMSVAGDLAVKFSNQYDSLKNLVEKYDSAARSAHELYNRTVDLIHAQIALNHANNNASAVSWGNGGTTASYFDGSTVTSSDTNGSSYNAGDGPQIAATLKTKTALPGYGYDSNCHWKKYSDGSRGSETRHSFTGAHIEFDHYEGNGIFYYNKISKCSVCGYEKKEGSRGGFNSNLVQSDGYGGYKKKSFKTGGYTGTWSVSGKTGMYTGSWNGPDLEENGKLAFLHQKELVLNADDTENMLSAVKLIREISQNIDLQAISQAQGFRLTSGLISTQDQVLQQEVTIHAEFPNATDHNEIEEAFNNLINKATQYVNRY